MASINWNAGQLITLNAGDTAACTGGLNPGQIYALFFYNSANADADCPVSVVWSNSHPPVSVIVPGTTAKQGLASLCFVSGDDTNTVSISVGQISSGVQVTAFIGSVKMPINTTGINNKALTMNGQFQPFTAFTRYYSVPASHWYSATIQSNINQFISVQFKQNSAVVNVVNATSDPSLNIYYCNKTAAQVTVAQSANQTLNWNLQGNGTQWVWINADSVQNSQSAAIALQSLVTAYEAFANEPATSME